MFKNCQKNLKKGVTLLEMIVVVAIVVIITAIIVGNLGGIQDSAALDIVATQVATIVRESQVYGVAQRRAGTEGRLPHTFGVHFEKPLTGFYLFEDLNDNGVMDKTSDKNNEVRQQYVLEKGIYVGGIKSCSSSTSCTDCSVSNITYQQRYPEPIFRTCVSPGAVWLRIVLKAPRQANREKYVDIFLNGQIAVNNPPK